ncbi:hypothetical protein [Clostridium sp. HBUAS56017]|uniref:hypothetical protein n=1 Tax=Clostridium sp. HBUAS56017 TaxID=2571128 RepID=UPI001177B22E|nr:hypothetical protein [Clostridium sp. HBUAS56017]
MDKKLFDYLYDNGINVYFPGQYEGECKENYVVIKDDGINSNTGKVGRGLIDLLFFVPISDYLECNRYKKQVKDLMKEFKDLRYTGNETGIVPDSEKKAYTFSIMYENHKRL